MNYKEKLEEAKRLYETANADQKYVLESLFPELAESEDERIRKALRERIIRYDPNNEILIKEEGISQRQFIAWLEKQGNANKEYWRGYREGKQEILYKYAELEKQEQNPQIATSTEAKEALYDKLDNHTYSFEDMYEASKQCYDSKYNKDEYCHEQSFKWGFQEGAEWREQKTAWSEEDDFNLQCCVDKIKYDKDNGRIGRNRELLIWLKSLKPRSQWRPSDEQIKVLEFFIPYVTKCSIVLEKSKGTLLSLLSDLKKLKG
jgi:hypothetical protein